MVKVGLGDTEREYPAGVSIAENSGLLLIYGAEPDRVLIAMHQSWDHAEVVQAEESE